MKAAEDMSTPVGTRVKGLPSGLFGTITGYGLGENAGRYCVRPDGDRNSQCCPPEGLEIIEEPTPADVYTLELTEQEAKVLRVIVGHVVGDFYNSPRRETSAIFDKFQKMGFWDEDKTIAGLASPATNGSLVYFRNYPEPEPEFVGHEIESCSACKYCDLRVDVPPCAKCYWTVTGGRISYFTPKEDAK